MRPCKLHRLCLSYTLGLGLVSTLTGCSDAAVTGTYELHSSLTMFRCKGPVDDPPTLPTQRLNIVSFGGEDGSMIWLGGCPLELELSSDTVAKVAGDQTCLAYGREFRIAFGALVWQENLGKLQLIVGGDSAVLNGADAGVGSACNFVHDGTAYPIEGS